MLYNGACQNVWTAAAAGQPLGEYAKGVSNQNVPDMFGGNPGPGIQTLYYPNQ